MRDADKLTKALRILEDAVLIATRRTYAAAAAAQDVDGLIEQQLLNIGNNFAAAADALDDLLKEMATEDSTP
jgi:hypothetical protein